MAAKSESELGSLLLWAGVAYVAYELYQSTQSASSGPAASTDGSGSSDVSSNPAAAFSASSIPASQSAGGTNPGGVSLTDLFTSKEYATAITPTAVIAPDTSYQPMWQSQGAGQTTTPAQAAALSAQISQPTPDVPDQSLNQYYASHQYVQYVAPGQYNYSATPQTGFMPT